MLLFGCKLYSVQRTNLLNKIWRTDVNAPRESLPQRTGNSSSSGFPASFPDSNPFPQFYGFRVFDLPGTDFKPQHRPNLMEPVNPTGTRVHVQQVQLLVGHYLENM